MTSAADLMEQRLKQLLDLDEMPVAMPIAVQDNDANLRPQRLASERQIAIIGQPAANDLSFCPIMLAAKMPYKMLRGKVVSKLMAETFFDDGKFWRRNWTIYYIWPPRSTQSLPLLLVPSSEIDILFEQINQSIKSASLSLAVLARKDPGFLITFPYQDRCLRPRYLGRCASRQQYNSLIHNCPGKGYDILSYDSCEPNDTQVESEAIDCDLKIKKAQDLIPSPNRSKEVRAQRAQLKDRNHEHAIVQVERFLGFRPSKIHDPSASNEWQQLTWEASQALEAAKKAAKNPPPIHHTNPAPHSFDSNVVFISIDMEWYERDQGKVTEIGFAILDTSDLTAIPPGPKGINWYPLIRSRHFRIREHAHLVNREFVQGCPGAFRFGKSEFIDIQGILPIVADCFRPPFFAPRSHTSSQDASEKRNIVLVGHGLAGDLRSLRRLGYDVTNLSTLHNDLPVADTTALYRALKKLTTDPSLATILMDSDIVAIALHNAGNDATYTMQAMIAIAVSSAETRNPAGSVLETPIN